MREIRLYGSEGGEAKVFLPPIFQRESNCVTHPNQMRKKGGRIFTGCSRMRILKIRHSVRCYKTGRPETIMRQNKIDKPCGVVILVDK